MNRVLRYLSCFMFLFSISTLAITQSLLTTEEVFSEVVTNNYDLQAARQNIALAEVLTSRENRGYLPTLSLNGGLGYSLNGVKSVFNFNFPDLNIQNIQSYNGNLGIESSYLVYDGGQRHLVNDKNKVNLKIASLQLESIQQLLGFNALQIYYNIAQSTYNLDLLKESLAISQERYSRTKTYYEYGKNNKVDVLNAKVDVARDSVSLNSIENDIKNLKLQLNQLTLRTDTDYQVDTTINLTYQLSEVSELESKLLNTNAELITLREQVELVKYDVEIAEKLNAPQIIASGAYNLDYQKNSEKSQLALNRTNGLNLGLSANWNIFDGGQQKVQKQLAAIDQSTAFIDLKNKENELVTQLNSLWNSYQNNLQNMLIEQQNIQTNRQNFELVKSLYENGQQSSIEFRQAQLNLINAQSQYYFAKISAKLSEVEIEYLLGTTN